MLSPERSSARVPECHKINKGGLDQYGSEHFEVYPVDTIRLEKIKRRKF